MKLSLTINKNYLIKFKNDTLLKLKYVRIKIKI